jgi:hypothetical protein
MHMTTKKSIYQEHLKQWLKVQGNKKKRGEIVDHICFVTGVHRKSVPRCFRRIQMRRSSSKEKRGRKIVYGSDVVSCLKKIWDMAGEPCAENLHGVIQEYVDVLVRNKQWTESDEVTKKLVAMSLGTMKKRVAKFKRKQFVTKGKSSTSPSTIHSLIPVRRGEWSTSPTGTIQIDTVAHCGHSLAGDFVYTVNCTDVTTLWGERRAQWNKGKIATVRSMTEIEQQVPFPILEWHPDSGSEFVNWHCKEWCDKKQQRLTRSRPNRKNDNCFVEERNGHIVRRWVGYTRFDQEEIVRQLNFVYDVLTPYLNHFVASIRIVSKKRIGAIWKVTREKKALTPYQRVLGRNDVSKEVKIKLTQEHLSLNPGQSESPTQTLTLA